MIQTKQQPWLSDHTPETFQALGEFIFMCSAMEISVHAVLKHLLQIDDELARMLVKEAAMVNLLEYLGQAARLRKLHADQMAAFELLREDLAYLQAVRSVVAHKPAVEQSGALIFHNTMTAPKVASIRAYSTTSDELKTAAEYGKRIIVQFLDLDLLGKERPAEYLKNVRELRTWRDKLKLPANPRDKSQQSSEPTLLLRPSWPKQEGDQ